MILQEKYIFYLDFLVEFSPIGLGKGALTTYCDVYLVKYEYNLIEHNCIKPDIVWDDAKLPNVFIKMFCWNGVLYHLPQFSLYSKNQNRPYILKDVMLIAD